MSDAFERIDSILVVGGGDAGVLTGLALHQTLGETEIRIVDDFEAGIPEVGKSTLLYFVKFIHHFLDIPPKRLLRAVDAAWKTSVYFDDWCGVELHSPLGHAFPLATQSEAFERRSTSIKGDWPPKYDREAEFHELYYRYQIGEFRSLYTELAETPGKTPMVLHEQDVFKARQGLPDVAYHFNSQSLNAFLRTVCRERGVELVDDRITAVDTTENRVQAVHSETATYTADLYVDASGFKRLLMGSVDNEFHSFDLPVDAAVVCTVDIDLAEVESATVVTSGEAGWFWQIDTTRVRDLGYVYSSEYLTETQAIEELRTMRDESISSDDMRRYRFNSGMLETPWMANCVAIGNALGFVEPLQSTALTTSALLADRLARLIEAFGRHNCPGLRALFNETAGATWQEVYDFVSLYYQFSSGETRFWEDARSINPGILPQFQGYQDAGFAALNERRRLTRTGTDLNGYELYQLILYGLGVESKFYEHLDLEPDPKIRAHVDAFAANLSDRVDEFLSYEEFFHLFYDGAR